MLSIFSILAIMVLDVNFNNPYKTADFLFFVNEEDAKKTDNNVVKLKGCLIHVHIRFSVDPFRHMYVIHFPKAIICIYKSNQKLDGGG